MKVLIIGASTNSSIGTMVGEALKNDGHQVSLSSRSGTMGIAVDICDPQQTTALLSKLKPTAIIHAAGVWGDPQPLGKIRDWNTVAQHVLVKSLGTLILFDSALRTGVKTIIVFGGPEISSDPIFGQFTVGNGALWTAVQFVERHATLRSYYLELPVIQSSRMAQEYAKRVPNLIEESFLSPLAVAKKVQEILEGHHLPGIRIRV